MANTEHSSILMKGVSAWNKWREENPGIVPDLSGAQLDKSNLRRIDFAGVHLDRASLAMSNLAGVNFREASLHHANLSGSNFQKAEFHAADLSFADLSKSNFTDVSLRGATLRGANLSGSNLGGVRLSGLDLRGANLRDSILVRADLSMADLDSADLAGADLSAAQLVGTDLTIATLSNANLSGATLSHARLERAEMTGVRLHGTVRDNWNIQKARCKYVYFDQGGAERTPKDRDFGEGEFARQYGLWGMIAFEFGQEVNLSELIAFKNTMRDVNRTHPEWDLKLHSLSIRGAEDKVVLSFAAGRTGREEIQRSVEQELRKNRQSIDRLVSQIERMPEFRDLSKGLQEPIWCRVQVKEGGPAEDAPRA